MLRGCAVSIDNFGGKDKRGKEATHREKLILSDFTQHSSPFVFVFFFFLALPWIAQCAKFISAKSVLWKKNRWEQLGNRLSREGTFEREKKDW